MVKCTEVVHERHKVLLHEVVSRLVHKWEVTWGKNCILFFATDQDKVGSCNHQARHIRLNAELVKKPQDLLECVIGHEMVHLLESTRSERFMQLLDEHYPTWREARADLIGMILALALFPSG